MSVLRYYQRSSKTDESFRKEGQLIVSVAKGIEEKTLMTMSQQIEEELPMANVAVLSGPSHAEEVSRGIPTTVVAGAKDRQTAEHHPKLVYVICLSCIYKP